MNTHERPIYISDGIRHPAQEQVDGGFVTLFGESYYRITNYDRMPPFFMNLVSSSDHWIFISSTGGLAAGRRNANSALFPYYTDDRIAENAGNTGHIVYDGRLSQRLGLSMRRACSPASATGGW